MKAITIWQPFASFIPAGLKQYETRGWKTSYRGPIAIHAAQRPISWCLNQVAPIVNYLAGETFGVENVPKLPTGKIVAIAELVECYPIDEAFRKSMAPKEFLLGNYEDGRYAWHLKNVKELKKPIEAKGNQGLWTWESCPACKYVTPGFVCHPECGGCNGLSHFEEKGAPTRCVFCGEKIQGHGNNPEPVSGGVCCDKCNTEIVVPARIRQMKEDNRK